MTIHQAPDHSDCHCCVAHTCDWFTGSINVPAPRRVKFSLSAADWGCNGNSSCALAAGLWNPPLGKFLLIHDTYTYPCDCQWSRLIEYECAGQGCCAYEYSFGLCIEWGSRPVGHPQAGHIFFELRAWIEMEATGCGQPVAAGVYFQKLYTFSQEGGGLGPEPQWFIDEWLANFFGEVPFWWSSYNDAFQPTLTIS